MDPAIVIEELDVVRGRRGVLAGVNWSVSAGQVVGLLGPSGSGKTTLLRCLVGVQRINAGAVTVLGLPAGHPLLRRRVGYMTQAAAVYDDLSVEDNLTYGARLL
ncbi:MAG: ATP-binding cassette domain-containing protein, partial [Actinomycetota bacterium]|nr:ATP-binding cassette domain-containing protein [Actinomycetota bacterium]